MFARIKAIFVGTEASIASITKTLDTMVADLIEHAEDHLNRAAAKGAQVTQLVSEVAEHNTTAINAKAIATKIGDLLK